MQDAFLQALARAAQERKLNIRNVLVRRDGEVFARWDFEEDARRQLYSASKTFASMAVGMAAAEGLLSLSDPAVKYLPEHAGRGWDGVTVEHLLTMSTGHATCPIATRHDLTDYAEAFFAETPACAPGEKFVYNNAATFLLSKIMTRRTGMSLRDWLTPRLFAPLGIASPRWDEDEAGVSNGFAGLYLTCEELSRGGQLLLDGGTWKGERLLPADYALSMTQKHISTADISDPWATADSRAGYGYQMWLNAYPGSSRMDGFKGQYCVLLPDKRAVVAFESCERKNMLGILALAWEFVADQL